MDNMNTDTNMMDAETQARMVMMMDKGATLGSQFMAVTFDALLCGVVICQCIRWAPNFASDSLLNRVAIAVGIAAAIFTTFFTWAIYMDHFVYNFGSYASFADFKYFGIYPIFDVMTVVPVQIIFADRSIRINNRSMYVTVMNYGLIALTFGSAVTITALSRGLTMLTKTESLKIFLVLWPAVCTITHLVLTGTILYGLFQSREGSRHTNQILDRVIFMSLESQIPGTVFAFTAIIVIASNVNSWFIPWIVVIHPKVFLIGCLAMINTRHTWQREGKLPSSIGSGRGESQPGTSRSGVSAFSHGPTSPARRSVRPGTVIVSTFDDIDGPGLRLADFSMPMDDKTDLEAMGMQVPVQHKSHLDMA